MKSLFRRSQVDLNVIVVGWEDAARAPNYPQAVANTRSVGAMIAKLIFNLHTLKSAPLGAMATRWEEELADLSVNETWDLIKDRINKAVLASTPITRTSGKQGKGWMDSDTLLIVRKKHKAFRQWKNNKNEESYSEYVKARNQAKAACRRAQRSQETKIAKEAKSWLDPAGPSFERYSTNVRLDKTDASFVDVIHTDAEGLSDFGFGIRISIGHVDFWVNGGTHQPGCPPETISLQDVETSIDVINCSHGRSLDLFTYSISRCRYDPQGSCTMGYHVSTTCRGDYEPSTTAVDPFC
ncbi:hypothetical protein EGW08_015846 [Elysia chlorotica]|uniref:Lipase domain-containing protein n=1 Tax=Elysia chlorotica TaxID=188477 RepID=A0A433T4B0_ELYCH|nr:hypothetical protein EGW08_015846 [Elysia chlorotica]